VTAAALLCLAWLAASVANGATTLFDENVRHAVYSISNPSITHLFSAITFLGSQAVVIGISACAAIAMFLKRRPDRALLVVITMAGAELWLPLLKTHFHRQRPEPFFGGHVLQSYSFPSGHALLSFYCYGLLCALASEQLPGAVRWLVLICGTLLVLAIGVSRIYLGVHYPTDVIAGYLTATAWMAAVTAINAFLAKLYS
jgi:undecaprenyl-diphosphatase